MICIIHNRHEPAKLKKINDALLIVSTGYNDDYSYIINLHHNKDPHQRQWPVVNSVFVVELSSELEHSIPQHEEEKEAAREDHGVRPDAVLVDKDRGVNGRSRPQQKHANANDECGWESFD